MIEKPKLRKPKKDKARKKRGVCSRCGNLGPTEIHHIFGGSYRPISEREDFVAELCVHCHREVHDFPETARRMKKKAQKDWESQKGHDREAWISLMGKSWL